MSNLSEYSQPWEAWMPFSKPVYPGTGPDTNADDSTPQIATNMTPSAPGVDDRPSWDVYFMMLAQVVATRATCPKRRVGSVLVSDRRILTTGYNGSPPGQPHCLTEGCYLEEGHCVRTLHAEQNALIQAALHGVSTKGSTFYTTAFPCHVCARMITGAGVSTVIFRDGLPNWSNWGREVLRAGKVNVARLSMTDGVLEWVLRDGEQVLADD